MIGSVRTDAEATAAVAAAIARRPEHLRILAQVAALELPDGWVGAGFVRNAVWDALHGHEAPTPLPDVDVVYFDPAETSHEADERHEAGLRAAAPDVPWSVKNQAPMHSRNGDAPYQSTAEALTRWPETCTAVAVRLRGDAIEVLAPLGLRDLFELVVRPTPHFQSKLEIYRSRARAKQWPKRWPRLRIEQTS